MSARDANIVLVIEDLEDDARLLQMLLAQLGVLNPIRIVLNGTEAVAYLKRLQRPDGSFRYSARYTTTPVWVTAQVLPALARKAFPLSG